MNANLLIKGQPSQPLDGFVSALSEAIGCARWEERQSSNYLGERYFRTLALGIEITAALADDEEFKDFQFWLCFQPEPGCGNENSFVDGIADCVARKLAQGGNEVIRLFDMGRLGGGGTVYRLNPIPGVKPRERVIMEEI